MSLGAPASPRSSSAPAPLFRRALMDRPPFGSEFLPLSPSFPWSPTSMFFDPASQLVRRCPCSRRPRLGQNPERPRLGWGCQRRCGDTHEGSPLGAARKHILSAAVPGELATQENTMKDTDIKRLLYTHLLCIFSIILSVFIPSLCLENFSILETHLTWLCICSGFVTAVNLVLYLVVKPNASSKRSSLSHKVTRFLKCCIYFVMSCFFFHVIFVLYGAPLIELALETFLFAVILSTFTTVPCLCLLGPNLKAWLRVFSRNG
ncbi:Phosphatidylinositol-glycan biosynthesis class F protein [Plecturocebus cupreus]